MADNQMSLSFLSRSVNEGLARIAVGGFVSQLDPTMEELCDIRTAVSEAVTNAIIHGYRDKIGKVYIQAKMKGNKVIVRVRDCGCGIGDINKAMQPLYTTATTGECAGLGFAMMQELCDKIKVASVPGRGTTVVLERTITSKGD